MALALGNGLEPKINETKKDSGNVLVRITSEVVKQVKTKLFETNNGALL